LPYEILIPRRVERQITKIPREFASRILDDLEGFADGRNFKRYDVRQVAGSPKEVPRYRMRSGNYRVIFFILHNRMVIEVISVRRKETGMEY
jgi:mRNA-degrading endonuclease RelE of RelBE toxin-antitoxin system